MFRVNEKMRGITTISLAAVLLMAIVLLDLNGSHNYCKATTTPDHLVISSNSSWCDGQHCHIEDEVEVWSETQTLFMVDLETSRMLAGENTYQTTNSIDASKAYQCDRSPAYYPCVDPSGNKRKVPPNCGQANRDPTCPIYK